MAMTRGPQSPLDARGSWSSWAHGDDGSRRSAPSMRTTRTPGSRRTPSRAERSSYSAHVIRIARGRSVNRLGLLAHHVCVAGEAWFRIPVCFDQSPSWVVDRRVRNVSQGKPEDRLDSDLLEDRIGELHVPTLVRPAPRTRGGLRDPERLSDARR